MAYGFKVWGPTGDLWVEITDQLPRFINVVSSTAPSGTSNHTCTGARIATSIIFIGGDLGDGQLGAEVVTNDSIRIYNEGSSTAFVATCMERGGI